MPDDIPSREAPASQPLTDGESAKADEVAGTGGHDPTKTEPELLTPNCDGLEKTPADLPEDTSGKSAPPSTQPDEDDPDAPHDNTDVDNTSPQGSVYAPPKPPQGGESPGGSVPDKIFDFKEDEREKRKPGRKNPREIGSRRTRTTPRPRSRPRRPPTSRPELVCRRLPGSWQWEVTLSADDECRITAVHRDGEPLEMVNRECRLSSLTGRLTIAFEDGENDEFALFDGKPLIFKLRNNWTGEGRKTGGITKGYFVVIGPNEWERTGHVPVEPEGCADKGFTAHYFYRNGTEPTENIGGFRECEVAATSSGFELIGECVFDDSEYGDLFVGAVPNLKSSPNIAWVRVGEEQKNGWRGENFRPDEGDLSEVLNGRQGRFFIRVYDSEVKLLDSGEFRYLRDLKEIRVNGERYTENTFLVPPSTGHPPTKVGFIGIGSITTQSILPCEVTCSNAQGDDLVVEPHPSRDRISCALESDTGCVDIVLNLPRIWWRMDRHGSESGEWHDTQLAVTRQEFREHAHANATMRLRFPQRIKSVRAGFDDELDRVYHRKNGENDSVIPLADFVDYSQIDRRLNEDASFNVECGGVKLALIQVSADPMPTIISFTREPATVAAGEQVTLRWATRNAESGGVAISPEIGPVALSGSLGVAPSKTTTYMLRLTASSKDDVTKTVTVTVRPSHQSGEKPIACVRRAAGRWRHGKGFSDGEIRAAGLTVAGATQRSLPFDKRRRSTHRANIERIKRSIDA